MLVADPVGGRLGAVAERDRVAQCRHETRAGAAATPGPIRLAEREQVGPPVGQGTNGAERATAAASQGTWPRAAASACW